MSSQAAIRQRVLIELALVAGGAIPGALLRWRLQDLGSDLWANLLGCLVLALLSAGSQRRPRLLLWGGIGFCGSLTTFSSWMLDLVRALDRGDIASAAAQLLINLGGGLALVAAVRLALARRHSS